MICLSSTWCRRFVERSCSRKRLLNRRIFGDYTGAFANKFAPSVPGMGRNQPLESSGQTK
ncbi:hypothetical protein CVE34_15150 [Pseudomonas syringae pv. actinidiae]|nr:hypothetical protein [Pseudomonas syringae pv. actinidiae]NAS80399.1 hypothetical protein [Pseudomonas syringae pv. actinidiae]NAT73440.1 hypothetical protein [Pseudomonas syringae pv. actinidiae]PHZ39233.1 hypothetical protein CS297_22460 [Pseudomonas syringae pv. actinidiae]PIH83732.1 hypothetical protein CTI50_01840 [Pseudomonas syringae pv. actinidiae]